jgi:hypothetical protein
MPFIRGLTEGVSQHLLSSAQGKAALKQEVQNSRVCCLLDVNAIRGRLDVAVIIISENHEPDYKYPNIAA